MKYSLKLTLLDDKGNSLVSSKFTEEHLKDMKAFHKIDFIEEMVKVMKLQHETGVPIEKPKEEYIPEFIEGLGWRVKNRRNKTADELMISPIEPDVMVTREDVQDLKWLGGISEEEAYNKLKAFYLGETDTL